MDYPHQRGRAGEDAFPGYLRQARAILAAQPVHLDEGPTGLPADFEALRWFPLPPTCLQSGSARAAGPRLTFRCRRRDHRLCCPGFGVA
jgi:hypothetical protein